MKFCRNCGSALPAPAFAAPRAPVTGPGPMPASLAALGGPMPGMPSGPIGGFPSPPTAPSFGGPIGGLPARGGKEATDHTVLALEAPSTAVGTGPGMGAGAGAGARVAQGSTIACPRCGTQTPVGFAYCQQCGTNLQAVAPTEAAAGARRGPSSPLVGRPDGPIDPHAGTLAQDDGPSVVAARGAPVARPQIGPGWGTAVLVNRDGSDGQRYPLSGEYVMIGRAGADIAFDDDRFLARQHARLERGGDGAVKIHPMDGLNGVFRKTDAPVELVDGTVILVGREVLRFERLDPEEVKLFPLVRHGVALFGSPPREPWGRLVQIVPSGGYRDVRHLIGDEVVLGREEGDLVFRDDAFLSRRHAAMTWDGRRAQITDLGSSNGTFVRITGPTVLRHGDHVRMGDQLLRIELGR